MESRVIEDPVTGTPMVIPLGRRSRTLNDRRTA